MGRRYAENGSLFRSRRSKFSEALKGKSFYRWIYTSRSAIDKTRRPHESFAGSDGKC